MGFVKHDIRQGDRFGRLVVLCKKVMHIKKINRKSTRTRYDCRCDCGRLVENVEGSVLASKHKESCGWRVIVGGRERRKRWNRWLSD